MVHIKVLNAKSGTHLHSPWSRLSMWVTLIDNRTIHMHLTIIRDGLRNHPNFSWTNNQQAPPSEQAKPPQEKKVNLEEAMA